jgi:hypothetical protein
MPNAADRTDLVDELMAGFMLIKVQTERTLKDMNRRPIEEHAEMAAAACRQAVKDCDHYIALGNRT